MKRLVARVIGIVIGLAVIGGLVVAFLPRPVMVDAVALTRGHMQVTVDEDGQTRIKDKYIVSAPLAGRLQRIQLRAGDSVEAGQTIIARIDPSDPSLLDARALAEAEARVRRAEAAVRRAATDLERTRAEMDYAEEEMARVQRAAERGAATQREIDVAMTAWRSATESYNAARFEQEIARFELEMAEAALIRSQPLGNAEAHDDGDPQWREQLLIASPIDGRVLRVFQESMAVVLAGTSLVELGDPTDLEIVVDVLSTDAVQIRPGADVLIEYWGGEHALRGRVRLVEPQAFTKISALGVEEQRVNVIIDFTSEPEERATLGDGYRVETRIVVWEEDGVLRIPTSALFRVDGEWAVFAVESERAHLRRVQIRRQSGLTAQVIDGLSEGDRIITHPGDKVEDGKRVQVR